MKSLPYQSVLFSCLLFVTANTNLHADELLLQDRFERHESDESKEQIGNGWSTNSRTRAKGNKQVDLDEGALHIYRHEVADHGVSVVHDLEFRDATISMRFRIGTGDELGINIADMNEKSVHAGHLCVAKIRLNKVSIIDLKTGRMNEKLRAKLKAKELSKDEKKLIASKEKSFPVDLDAAVWHDLKVVIKGQAMTVSIDGKEIGALTSPGIGHATKRRLRLAVLKQAWVDDLAVTGQ